MKAPWVLAVEGVPTPEPGLDDVLVKILATGICGSDFHGFSGENGRRKAGQVMGHETVGHVSKVGGNVSDLAVGTCVTVNPVLSCDDCDVCRAGNEQSCPHRKVIGVAPELTSAFAEYLLVRRSNVIALADGVAAELGALVEPLAVGYHAATRGGCSSQDTVLVIGGGPIGQAAYLAARRLGATKVAVSDINPTRRALCAELGAAVIDPSATPLEESIVATLGTKATLVIDAVGATATLADAMGASAFGARVVLVGMAGAQLAGQDFLVGLDRVRADAAGQELMPVPGLAASTACGLARRVRPEQWAALESGLGAVHQRMLDLLPASRRDALCQAVTIDIDATDVEVYGRRKRGVAYNYQGQWCGRPGGDLGADRDGVGRRPARPDAGTHRGTTGLGRPAAAPA